MTSPADWPTTPPTEPGWYWLYKEPTARKLEALARMGGEAQPQVVQIVIRHNGKLAVECDGSVCVLSAFKAPDWWTARWRPGRIEP